MKNSALTSKTKKNAKAKNKYNYREPHLTGRQKKWAMYFAETGNGTEAAKRAGYTVKNADQISCLNQNKPYVMAEVQRIMAKIESESIAKADEILKYLTSIVRGEIQEEVVVTEGLGEGVSVAKKIKKDLQIKDRIKAAELIGKRYGLFNDKLIAPENMELTIKIDYGDDE